MTKKSDRGKLGLSTNHTYPALLIANGKLKHTTVHFYIFEFKILKLESHFYA